VFWGEFVRREPAAHRRNMERLLAWAAPAISAPMSTQVPLERWTEAFALIGDRKAKGKII
jgi:NADPH2:quinone reductase